MVIAKPPSIKTYSTAAYYTVAREADSVPGKEYKRGDGRLHYDELTLYRQNVQDHLDKVNQLNDSNPFGGYYRQIIDQIKRGLQGRLEVANNMINYFNRFTSAQGPIGICGTPSPTDAIDIDNTLATPAAIRPVNIYNVAKTDGRPWDISGKDLQGPVFYPMDNAQA